ncbi:hypothetical protein GCM10010266_23260 [Streptomyces griseomycini]|nr:hypothetical protein GCM10010266_23260 [Streptomyces griseomycini]
MTSNDPSAPGNRPNRRRALGRGPGAAPPTTPPATPEGGTAVPAEPGPPLAPPAEGAGAGTPGRVLPPVGPGVRPAQRTSAPVPGPSEGGPGVRQAGRPAPSGPPRAQEAADGPEGAAGPPPGPVAPPSAGTGGTVRPAAERSEPDGSPVGSTPAPDDLDARPDRGTAARPVPGAPVRAEPDGTPASEPDARAVGTGTAGASAEPDPVPRGLGAEPPVGAVGLSGASASGVLAPGTEAVSPGAGASGSGAGTVEPGAGTLEQGAGAAGPKTRAAGSRTGALGTGTGPEGGVSGGEEGDGRFTVRLANFEGPFDLLLQLIAKHKLDVTEVALSKVTDEFMAYIRALGPDWDLDETTEFLVVAATLLDLKAARLLPAAEVEDEADLALLEARDLLFARLLQYRAYKQIAEIFSRRLDEEDRRHPRTVGLEPHHAELLPEVVISIGPEGFARLAVKAMQPRPKPQVYVDHIHAPLVSVQEQAGIVVARLRELGEADFRALVEDTDDTLTVVARFLALLELYREKAVALEQETALGELTVRWTGGDGDAVPKVTDEFDRPPEQPEEEKK